MRFAVAVLVSRSKAAKGFLAQTPNALATSFIEGCLVAC